MPRKTATIKERRKHPKGEPLLINVNLKVNGSVYWLDPLSQDLVKEEFPEARGIPLLFFGYRRKEEFESLHGPLWELAGTLVTGLTLDQIAQLGGMELYYPREKRVVWQWKPSRTR